MGAPGWVDHVLGALNAAVGDYLESRGNGLAVPMELREGNQAVAPEAGALRKAFPAGNDRVVLFVHGLGCTEALWAFPGRGAESYGAALARDAGITPVYLRYNTGRAIADNGRDLAHLLEAFALAYPHGLRSLDLVGHSMGGLVLRSACRVALDEGLTWLSRVRRAVYLGSPHEGAPLERFAKVAASVLRVVPDPTTRTVGDIADLRSAGVKDLGDGRIAAVAAGVVPLSDGIVHHFVVGSLAESERHVLSQLFGDAIVPLASASAVTLRGAGTPGGSLHVMARLNHLALAHHDDVYAVLKELWAKDAESPGAPSPAAGEGT